MPARDVVSIGIAAVAADFTVDVSTALFSMFQFFEDDDAGAFAHDETVAVFIERTRSVSRVIVARAEAFIAAKPATAPGETAASVPPARAASSSPR